MDFMTRRAAASRRGTFSLGMTQHQLAEELGSVREVISRELRELKRAGIVEALGTGRYRLS
jgi:DNA-binding transcriptional regulator LsrR (DeoR family)